MPIDMKTRPELQETGRKLRELLAAGLSKEWAVLERPYPIAHLFADSKSDKMDIREHDFECMVSAYFGLVVQQWVEPYVALHEKLTARGHTSRDEAFEFGNDAYVWVVADREVEPEKLPSLKGLFKLAGGTADAADDEDDEDNGYTAPKHKVKVIGLETQTRNFIVVLIQQYGRWHLHFRRFWADLREVSKSPYGFLMDEYADRQDLTLLDVVKLAHQAADLYGDDMPGVSYPTRPLLSTYLVGDLMAGSEKAGIGLRYGDFRDKGYVMSFKNDDDRPEVDRATECDFGEVGYVAYNLASAIDVLSDET